MPPTIKICSICLDNLLGGKDEFMRDHVAVVWKECGHTFHQLCSDQVIAKQQADNDPDDDYRDPWVCPSCPLCRTEAKPCAEGYCDTECGQPYTRLYLQDDDDGTPDKVFGDEPAVTKFFTLVELAHEVGVDVEKLRKKLNEVADSGRWTEPGAWDEDNMDETLDAVMRKNKEGLEKIVREVQKETGWERLTDKINAARLAYNHFSSTIDLFSLIDQQCSTMSELDSTIHDLQHEARLSNANNAKLVVANSKIAQWEEDKRREIEVAKQDAKVEARGEWSQEKAGIMIKQMQLFQESGKAKIELKLEVAKKQELEARLLKVQEDSANKLQIEKKKFDGASGELKRVRAELAKAKIEIERAEKEKADARRDFENLRAATGRIATDLSNTSAGRYPPVNQYAAPNAMIHSGGLMRSILGNVGGSGQAANVPRNDHTERNAAPAIPEEYLMKRRLGFQPVEPARVPINNPRDVSQPAEPAPPAPNQPEQKPRIDDLVPPKRAKPKPASRPRAPKRRRTGRDDYREGSFVVPDDEDELGFGVESEEYRESSPDVPLAGKGQKKVAAKAAGKKKVGGAC